MEHHGSATKASIRDAGHANRYLPADISLIFQPARSKYINIVLNANPALSFLFLHKVTLEMEMLFSAQILAEWGF